MDTLESLQIWVPANTVILTFQSVTLRTRAPTDRFKRFGPPLTVPCRLTPPRITYHALRCSYLRLLPLLHLGQWLPASLPQPLPGVVTRQPAGQVSLAEVCFVPPNQLQYIRLPPKPRLPGLSSLSGSHTPSLHLCVSYSMSRRHVH